MIDCLRDKTVLLDVPRPSCLVRPLAIESLDLASSAPHSANRERDGPPGDA